MEIVKQFESASIEEIEAHIQEEGNRRDAINVELLALNHLRDRKLKEKKRLAALAAFEAEHGPVQVIKPGSVVAAPSAPGGLLGVLGKLFGAKERVG